MVDYLSPFNQTPIYDLSSYYSDFVPFTANSAYPIHRWYRFKEGFSRDLVHLAIGTLPKKPEQCLDVFAGSGTTPLACQEIGIKCHSIEVNPFLHHLTKTKLSTDYDIKCYDEIFEILRSSLSNNNDLHFDEPIMSTLTERENVNKWLYHKSVLQEILSIKNTISLISTPYKELLLVALASILQDVGNTVKDGKCVRYKPGWREITTSRENVRSMFINRLSIFRQDIVYINNQAWKNLDNSKLCLKGNALDKVKQIQTNSVDFIMTSPPYLNSFDYTDIYMPELWVLGFVNSYEDVRRLRSETLKSHVQVKWGTDLTNVDNDIMALIDKIAENKKSLWNTGIPEMVGGYFLDIKNIFTDVKRVLKPNGRLCVIIATSSYYNVCIPTDLILAKIAIELGFKFVEMRVIRKLKRSSKQTLISNGLLPPMRESMLIFER